MSIVDLLSVNAICFSIDYFISTSLRIAGPVAGTSRIAGRRSIGGGHLAFIAGLTLLGGFAVWGVTRGLLGYSLPELQPLAVGMALAVGGAVVSSLWDRNWRYPVMGLFVFGLAGVGLGQVESRLFAGSLFYLGQCRRSGSVFVGDGSHAWLLSRSGRLAGWLKIPRTSDRWSMTGFGTCQAILIVAVATQAVWISLDISFEGLGEGVALFGLSGRLAACSIALMLLGSSVLMAWQSTGTARAGWQFATFAAGLLFTTTVGWSRIETTGGPLTVPAEWLPYATALLLSASMMTVMTRFGLAVVLRAAAIGSRELDWHLRSSAAWPCCCSVLWRAYKSAHLPPTADTLLPILPSRYHRYTVTPTELDFKSGYSGRRVCDRCND